MREELRNRDKIIEEKYKMIRDKDSIINGLSLELENKNEEVRRAL